MLDALRVNVSGMIAMVLLAIAAPVKALEVKIAPPTPQLGDTISVAIATEDSSLQPTVTVDGKQYPVFAIGNGYRALIPTSPLNSSGKMTLQVKGDGQTSNLGVWLKNRTFPIQRITLSGQASRPATATELERVSELKNLVTPSKMWQGAFVRPSAAEISTVYGIRRYYNGVFASDYYHKGVDYAGGTGSPVVAPAGGKIRLVGREDRDFHVHGNTIGIDHGQGVVSILMHLQDIYVAEGDEVRAGQKIATIGATGASTGPHLHWGLYVNGVAVDPVPWRFQAID
jgi:murein DD-endopeptidase MepM/ murein hydrolase activator NlpD